MGANLIGYFFGIRDPWKFSSDPRLTHHDILFFRKISWSDQLDKGPPIINETVEKHEIHFMLSEVEGYK